MSGDGLHVHGPHDHEASNPWAFYRAESGKQGLAALAAEIMVAAQQLEADAKDWDAQSDAQMLQHHRWAQATTALQIAVALAAIALLTQRKWLEHGIFAVSALGLAQGALAAFHV